MVKVIEKRIFPRKESIIFVHTGEDGQPIYVTNYECPGNSDLFGDASEMELRIKESHVSFLSGHASFSFQVSIQ